MRLERGGGCGMGWGNGEGGRGEYVSVSKARQPLRVYHCTYSGNTGRVHAARLESEEGLSTRSVRVWRGGVVMRCPQTIGGDVMAGGMVMEERKNATTSGGE